METSSWGRSTSRPYPPRVFRALTTTTAIENGTRLAVRHEDFRGSEAAVEHAGGWERLLDWLSA
jgi:hypothetical protein